MNKAEKFLQSAAAACDDERLAALAPGSTPAQQARCVAEGLRIIEENGGDALVRQVMRPCRCIGKTVTDKARKLYLESHEDMETFLQALNREGLGGGKLALTDEGDVLARYDRCYCGLAKQGSLPQNYCECSCGWFEALFSGATQQPVSVMLLRSILGGAKTCDFRIACLPQK